MLYVRYLGIAKFKGKENSLLQSNRVINLDVKRVDQITSSYFAAPTLRMNHTELSELHISTIKVAVYLKN